jgi:hypothetical protein
LHLPSEFCVRARTEIPIATLVTVLGECAQQPPEQFVMERPDE